MAAKVLLAVQLRHSVEILVTLRELVCQNLWCFRQPFTPVPRVFIVWRIQIQDFLLPF
jgi:hypothetical protein